MYFIDFRFLWSIQNFLKMIVLMEEEDTTFMEGSGQWDIAPIDANSKYAPAEAYSA